MVAVRVKAMMFSIDEAYFTYELGDREEKKGEAVGTAYSRKLNILCRVLLAYGSRGTYIRLRVTPMIGFT